jgi:Putative auto-transporter adhesin, head GIN domain
MTTVGPPIRRGMPSGLFLVLFAVLFLVLGAGIVLLVQHNRWGESSTSTGVQGSGIPATQTRNLRSFASVDLAGASKVTIHVGGDQSVVVHADDNLIDLVTTDVRHGRLVIDNHPDLTTRSPMSVDVTVSELETLVLSGSGIVTADGVRAKDLSVRVPGSGLVRLSGTADRLHADLAGSGDVQLQDLAARDVTAKLSGSGRLQVHAAESLDAVVSGSGAIFYTGDPASVSRNVTGSGAILHQ